VWLYPYCLYGNAATLVNAETYPELADVDLTGKKYLATPNSYLKSLLCKTQLQVDVPRTRGVIYNLQGNYRKIYEYCCEFHNSCVDS